MTEYVTDKFKRFVRLNLDNLENQLVSCVECSVCSSEDLCIDHRRIIVRLHVCDPLDDTPTLIEGNNLLSNYWLRVISLYTVLSGANCLTSLAYLLTLPRVPTEDEPEGDELRDFVISYVNDCNDRRSTLPLMLFATDFLTAPASYKRVIYAVFILLLNSRRDFKTGKQAILWIDHILSYIFHSDPLDSLQCYPPNLMNGSLDDETGDSLFIVHRRGMNFELEIALNDSCIECRRADRVCIHPQRLLDIFEGLGEIQQAISLIRSSEYADST